MSIANFQNIVNNFFALFCTFFMHIIHHHGVRDDHHTNAPTHIYIEAAADLFSSNITIILSSPCGEEDELLHFCFLLYVFDYLPVFVAVLVLEEIELGQSHAPVFCFAVWEDIFLHAVDFASSDK